MCALAKSPEHNFPQADKADNCPHPREVYGLIGHENAEMRFRAAFNASTLHHAWLITGAAGIGKASLAYRMVRTVLGGVPASKNRLDVPASDPVAQRVQSLGHGDFLLIRRPYDMKTKKLRAEIPVAEARKIGDFFSRKAAEGGWRVCLIDGIDDMNASAANGVLKTLEEPPEKALLILLSAVPGRLLATIRSRCMHVPLRPVRDTDMHAWLESQTNADADDIQAAVRLSHGAPGRALALIQNADTVLRPLSRFVKAFPHQDIRLFHTISDTLALAKNSISHDLFWDALQSTLKSQAVYAATGVWEGAFTPMALDKPADAWANISTELAQMQMAATGLNMHKKHVLLQGLMQIGTPT